MKINLKHRNEINLKSYYKHREDRLKTMRNYRRSHLAEEKNRNKKYQLEHVEHIKRRDRERHERNPFYIWAMNSLRQHRNQGYRIEITILELSELAENVKECGLCGVQLNWSYGTKHGLLRVNSPTVDRINNDITVNKSSIQIICYACNSGKNQGSNEEYIARCIRVANRNHLVKA